MYQNFRLNWGNNKKSSIKDGLLAIYWVVKNQTKDT